MAAVGGAAGLLDRQWLVAAAFVGLALVAVGFGVAIMVPPPEVAVGALGSRCTSRRITVPSNTGSSATSGQAARRVNRGCSRYQARAVATP